MHAMQFLLPLKKLFIPILCFLYFVNNANAQRSTITDTQIYKLNLAAQNILYHYVDTVNKINLVENAIKGMLEDLDPHSSYLTSSEVKSANEPLQGNFKGVGIEFNVLKDTLLIVSVIDEGPSAEAGLRPGDRIIIADGDTIAGIGLKNADVQKRLRGEEGTVVALKILRRGSSDLLEFNITRGKIPIYSIDAAYLINPNIGYVKINRFSATTHQEFMDAMKTLKKEGMKKLIIDLQGNGGGYLWAAIQLANEFISKDKLIVYTKSRTEREDRLAFLKGSFEKHELVILVDEGSASASEILAGAIQDWDRGILVGRRTFGKGLVQRPFSLPDGSEMRLTIARYYTPSGRCIQKSYENGRGEYRKELQTRIEHGELFTADSISYTDSLPYKTLTLGRTVYGGGGIMPDIFVPLDTTEYSDFFRQINQTGILNQFTLNYVDQNRTVLRSAYPSIEPFMQNFSISNSMYQQMIVDAKRDHIEYTEADEVSASLIQLQMKAFVARYLFNREDFYRVIKTEDPSYRKAIEILENTNNYNEILQ